MTDQEIGAAHAPMRLHRRLQPAEELEAEPVHASVEMQGARRGPAAPPGEGGPAGELLFAADHRREAMLCIILRLGAALEAVEHVDPSLAGQDKAGRKPFAEMGDEEDARSCGPQRGRGFREAGPISVGLDDRGATPRRRATREFAPVRGQRAKVDRKPHWRASGSDCASHPWTFSISAVMRCVANLHRPM